MEKQLGGAGVREAFDLVAAARLAALGSVSAAALGLALFAGTGEARACTFTVSDGPGGISGVAVDCPAGQTTTAFATSIAGFYDGSGSDIIDLAGATIVEGDFDGVPPFAPIEEGGEVYLDEAQNTIDTLDGDDVVTMSGGTVGSAATPISVFLGGGADTFTMMGGTLYGTIFGQGGGNTYDISGGTIDQQIYAGSQNDIVSISGSANIIGSTGDPDAIGMEDGDDVFEMSGGTVGGAVSGGNGNDELTVSGGTIDGFLSGNDGDDDISVSGGTIQGDVLGGAGADTVTFSGGTIAGDIQAGTVNIYGGTLGGDVTGLSGDTLTIDASLGNAPIALRNGVTFSGTGVTGFISNSDLGGSQVFDGFSRLAVDGSTIRFSADQVIDTLNLSNGATLFSTGAVSVLSQGGARGSLAVNGSTVSMINNSATDVLLLGGVALNNATIGVDVDQEAALSDRIEANGIFTAQGTNTVLVNLLGQPVLLQATEIPIIAATGAQPGGNFVISGIPGTAADLFEYEVVQGADGGLFLRATPIGQLATAAGSVDAAVSSQTVETATAALYGVLNDAAQFNLGLGNGAPVAATPTFGIFASGQFAHAEHDGFGFSSGPSSGKGPGFESDDFSLAVNLDWNAAKQFGFDSKYGLNFGFFGGYTSTDLDLDGINGLGSAGSGRNESGMVGMYSLFRQGQNYVLVSGMGLFGNTDVTNNMLGASGAYDTTGYALTASAGRIFALGERLRFDLRGGILGTRFTGDAYVDSAGIGHGRSKISFGAVKFEPGIYGDYRLGNGMVFSPYLRADLQQRFSYRNESSVADATFKFDDSDFSVAAMAGFNLRMTPAATLSSEVRAKASADSTTFAGKIGLKVAF